jgi:hypothetical protein
MQIFDNITEARAGIMVYSSGPLLTESAEIIAKIQELSVLPSPVDQIVQLGEYLYTKAADISDEGKSLAGGLIAFATANGWHGLLDDNRGNLMVQDLCRDLGVTAVLAGLPPALDP